MASGEEYLLDWARYYATHRDIHRKEIKEITESNGVLHLHLKEGSQKYVASPSLDKKSLDAIRKNELATIVTFNQKKSIEALLGSWRNFCEYPNLTVIFVNPLSTLDLKWAIRPHIHGQICDLKALRPGIRSLSSGVELLNDEKIKKILAAP